MLQKKVVWKKLLLLLCIGLITISGCTAQMSEGLYDMFGASSKVVLQIPTVHTERPDMLDKGEWLANDDAASHISINDKKILPACRNGIYWSFLDALLACLSVMFAYVTARIYHGSSCPTRGLSRILAFILKTDGQKDRFSFSF